MCGGYKEPQTAEEFRRENSEYEFIKFTNAQGVVAYLIKDPEDANDSTAFDAVLDDGRSFGWDYEAEARGFLAQHGFTEASEEDGASAGETVNV